jgi:uncharacterized protein (TIGR02270 family)
VRLAAARSAARFGDVTSKDTLLALAEGADGTLAEAAASARALLDEGDAAALVRRWASSPRMRRIAIVASEVLGDPELVPLLIGWMSDDELARRAGDAFAAIVGVDLAEHDLTRPKPAVVPGEPTDDPDDPRVSLGPDHAMLFPAPLKVAAWWRANEHRFGAGEFYLAGHAVRAHGALLSQDHLARLRQLARIAPPRCQTTAAARLAAARPALPTLETHALATWEHSLPGWGVWSDVTTERGSRMIDGQKEPRRVRST